MIQWLGHAAFLFMGTKIIYSDPYQIDITEPKADIVLITHNHFDHCVPEEVRKIAKKETVVVTTADCAEKMSGLNVKIVKPGDSIVVDGVNIETVPAYNINKPYHPKANGWIGFIFTLDGKRIYQSGDTDLIPEMKNIKADTVLLPVGGTYTMNAAEAAEAVSWIKPKVAIPMHWGSVVGSISDAEQFKKLAKCEVQILEKK